MRTVQGYSFILADLVALASRAELERFVSEFTRTVTGTDRELIHPDYTSPILMMGDEDPLPQIRAAATATKHDLYIALFLIVRDCLSANRREHPGIQRLNALASLIFSAEFLPGLHPANNLLNLSTTESTQ